jgi:putative phosphoesterase
MILGLISDTHGLMRDTALVAMHGAGLIIHAGDVGERKILDALKTIAPVVAVRGNIDTANWTEELPPTATLEADSARIHVLHDLNQLDPKVPASGISIVVSGHSHKPGQALRAGVLYINPGSAGPRRFKLPITVARLNLQRKPWTADFIDVSER